MSDKPRKRKKEKIENVEVIDFSELGIKTGLDSVGRLVDLLNKCVEIDMSTLEIQTIRDREVAVVLVRYDDREERRHTFSSVIVKQLKAAKELYSNMKITARVVKVRNYYQLIGCK